MKYQIIIVWIIALFLGCTKENTPSELTYTGDVELSIATKTNNTAGRQLVRQRRIMIFHANTGVIAYNQSVTSPSGYIDIAPVFTLKIKEGSYSMVVICNETTELSTNLNEITNRDQLSHIILTTPNKEEDLVLSGNRNFMIKAIGGNPERPAISTDNGLNWEETRLTVSLQRIASKFSLRLRKKTDNESDKIWITKIELINLARHSFLQEQPYTGAFSEKVIFTGNTELLQNESYTPISSDIILNEYLLSELQNSEQCAAFRISATYAQSGQLPADVTYISPVTGIDAANYSLKRNNHYRVDATIRQIGEIEYTTSAGYDIADWENTDNGNVNIGGVITVSRKVWSDGTHLNTDGTIDIMANTSITFEFGLASPDGARWTAMLSNNIDFEFDLSGDGVREGVTRPGVVYNIRIRPKRIISSLEGPVTTEFYILVDNGNSIETDINSDDKTGKGNRYIIKQRPSS